MAILRQLQQDRTTLFYDATQWSDIMPAHFEASHWQALGDITGQISTGRGTTWFFRKANQEYVLKRYHRGGKIAVALGDRYFYTGLAQTRALQEWVLLNTLSDLDLPVPRAIAGRIHRQGLFYSADLIMTRIPEATPLSVLLTQDPLDETIWRQVGQTVSAFHQHNAYHADLTANNILLGENNKIWVLDFDQGSIKSASSRWKQANLNRLKRSFNKMSHTKPTFLWREDNWQQLMAGYHEY